MKGRLAWPAFSFPNEPIFIKPLKNLAIRHYFLEGMGILGSWRLLISKV